jgi:hypothetical protein
MIDSYLALDKKIKSLIGYIDKNKQTKIFINNIKKEQGIFQQYALWLDVQNLDARIYEYNSYIMSLYGGFEKFIESILAEYIDCICELHSEYKHLPVELISNNIKKNAELLNLLDYPKNKDIDENALIRNLHRNINEQAPFIDTHAFCQHTTNFRIKAITEYFKCAGVSDLGKGITRYEPLKTVLNEMHDNHSNLELSKTFRMIDDLADRRNLIAHGADNEDILDSDEILKMCSFIHSFAESLNFYLTDLISERISKQPNEHLKLNKNKLNIIKTFGSQVICFNSNNFEISNGSKILAVRETEQKATSLSIEDIQVNGESVEKISSSDAIDIGIRLSSKFSASSEFYLLDY